MSFLPSMSPTGFRQEHLQSLSRSDTANTLFIQPRQSNPVTPEYPSKDIVFSKSLRPSPEHRTSTTERDVSVQESHVVPSSNSLLINSLAPRPGKSGEPRLGLPPHLPISPRDGKSQSFRHSLESPPGTPGSGTRLNKFVRRLHDMLQAEKDSGVVDWRRGLLVLHSTDVFAKILLPKYFNTRNFKTFRRQLNYYGFVHVRSFSTTGSSTTALWVNKDLANEGTEDISSVLKLRRVEPCDTAKTAEGRRQRKEEAIFTVEEDIGVSAKTLQLEQIRSMATGSEGMGQSPRSQLYRQNDKLYHPPIPSEVRVVSVKHTVEEHGYDSTTSDGEDPVSTSAANVLLMLSRA